MKSDENATVRLRDAVIEFGATTFHQPFEKLNEKQRSLALARFYIDRIHNVCGSYISEEDFDEGWVDNANDSGADFVHRDDGSVLVLQIKYGGRGAKARHDTFSHFQNVLLRLNNQEFKKNRRLADAAAEIDWERDRFSLKYIWLGEMTEEARRIAGLPAGLPKVPGLADRVELQFLDEADLRSEYKEALSIGQGATPPADLWPAGPRGKAKVDKIVKIDGESKFPSYVLVVEATQLTDLYGRDKEALFALNIRNYLGDTGTNREIVKTAKEKSDVFFHLNNGISCLVKEASIDAERGCLHVDGLQIVNGAQTVKSLVKARGAWTASRPPCFSCGSPRSAKIGN